MDLDAAGVLNNSVYLTLVEQARLAYFGALGLMCGDQFPFLLGETTVRYLRPGGVGPMTIATRVSRLGTKSFDMDYVLRSEAGEDVARVRATLVWVDDGLASTPIPDEARRKMAEHDGLDP